MDINAIISLYASGMYTREELQQILEGIGFSAVIVNVLLVKADHRKATVQNEAADQISSGIHPVEIMVTKI